MMNSALNLVLALAILAGLIWRLPVNGWESLLWFVGMAVMAVIRRPHERPAKDTPVDTSKQDKTEMLLLVGVMLGASLVPVLHLITGVLSFANYSMFPGMSWLALPVMSLGLWLFWRSHADLGSQWSVSLELRENHGLITQGVYARIRHPMYAAIFLMYIAQALLIHNWIAGLSGLASFGLMYVIRVPREEAMMREQFGVAYDDYMLRAGRLWPTPQR